MAAKELNAKGLQDHLDRLAKRLRAALNENAALVLDANVEDFKSRIAKRAPPSGSSCRICRARSGLPRMACSP